MSATDPETMARECIEVEQIFTPKECDFLESISAQIEAGRLLTDKQDAWLRDLYKKACDSPH
jgi:hypothetical protein